MTIRIMDDTIELWKTRMAFGSLKARIPCLQYLFALFDIVSFQVCSIWVDALPSGKKPYMSASGRLTDQVVWTLELMTSRMHTS